MPTSYHQKIKRALTEAGFIVRRLEKHEFRHLWIISMYPGTALDGQSVAGVVEHIRRMAASLGQTVPNRAISVMFYAGRIKVAFPWPHGKPGIWSSTQREKGSVLDF